MNINFIVIIIGAVFLGLGFAKFWFSKCSVKRPKHKGHKREYYTKGEVIMARIKRRELG